MAQEGGGDCKREGVFTPWWQGVVLGLALSVAFLVIGLIAYYARGRTGLLAAGVAWGVCLPVAYLTLLVNRLLCHPELVLYQVLVGIALRMGPLLAISLFMHLQGGWLAEAGFIYWVLGFYLVVLLVETFLTVMPLR